MIEGRSLSAAGRRRAVLVTGANGFLGKSISAALERACVPVVRGCRRLGGSSPPAQRWIEYGSIGEDVQWAPLLEGIGSIVHLAGIAHRRTLPGAEAVQHLERVNVQAAEQLALSAAASGVARFIFMSSALVHGPAAGSQAIVESDALRPEGHYARCKLAAEQRLRDIGAATGMEVVILRPPMVYGANAVGNFRRLVDLVRTRLPLPLGRATAPRSFVGVDNLADATVRCVLEPAAAGETFLICDAEVSSTAHLIDTIAAALGRRVLKPRVPPALVAAVLRLFRRGDDFQRLFAPFLLSNSHMASRLSWAPPISMSEGICRALYR